VSFDLDVRREDRAQLDRERVLRDLRGLEGVEDADDELYWELAHTWITFYVFDTELGIEVKLRDDPSDEELRADFERVLDVIEPLAGALGARIWDPQLDEYVDGDREKAIGSLVGS
jgi:hypothetical protein